MKRSSKRVTHVKPHYRQTKTRTIVKSAKNEYNVRKHGFTLLGFSPYPKDIEKYVKIYKITGKYKRFVVLDNRPMNYELWGKK